MRWSCFALTLHTIIVKKESGIRGIPEKCTFTSIQLLQPSLSVPLREVRSMVVLR